MDAIVDLDTLSREDLIEELKVQFERNRELKQSTESDTQRIYELTRQLDTANATQAYLMQELEQLNANTTSNELAKTEIKLKKDYDELRKQYSAINLNYETLQQEFAKQHTEYVEIKRKLETKTNNTEHSTNLENIIDDYQKRIALLENENMELLQKLEEVQSNELQQTLAMAAQEKKIEVLLDQVNCLEENLKSKKAEIDDKLQILESVQEQLLEANAKIAVLTTTPQNNEQKGNSLFAEVDDQRQAMKQLLTAQKKNYLQMKKAYTECEYEIRRLKRENIAMHTELQTCSKIFYSADKTYQDKLKERIQYLLNQNEHLEKQLTLTQERLKNVAGDNSVSWLESMLNFCRQETDDLKKQLHSSRIQRASLEEQLRNTKQEMARWRFESLKVRCILMDRENILDEQQIAYNAFKDNTFHITDEHIELLRKQSTSAVTTYELHENATIFENNRVVNTQTLEQKDEKLPTRIETMPCQAIECNNIAQTRVDSQLVVDENKENLDTNFKTHLALELSENVLQNIDANNVKETSPVKASILTKTHSLLERSNNKHVKFTDDAPMVYKLSPRDNNCSADSSSSNEDNKYRKQCSKPQIVVRRVVIKSKKEIQKSTAS